MKDMDIWLLAYLVNALWQAPLVFLAAWGAARLAAKAGPGMEHRVWAGALMAEALVPACPLSPTDLWLRIEALMALGGGKTGGDVRIVLGPTAGLPGTLQVPAVVLWVLLIAFAIGAAYAACRMAWGLVQTRRMLRGRAAFAPGRARAEMGKVAAGVRIWGKCSGACRCADCGAGDGWRAAACAAGAAGLSGERADL